MSEFKEITNTSNSISEKQIEIESPTKEHKSGFPEISIKAEPIFHLGNFKVTNSLFTAVIVLIVFFLLALKYSKEVALRKKSGFFYFFNMIIKSIYDIFYSVLKEKTEYFFPLLGAYFLFVLFNNWFGLLPGVGSIMIKIVEHGKELTVPLLRGNNADLNTTLVLGLVSVTSIQYFGVKYLGFGTYIKKFLDFSNPINFSVGILEIVSEISKVLSFSFRLFGNIFAGEVLLTIVAFLIPVAASFPFLLLEIFVGLVQALVFSMLSAVFISMAVTKHH